jgi:ABC-2 type transport system ATP-binding protein
MDDLEALCAEVTILATGRVVFSGPVNKLTDEDRALDYRLRASDPAAARAAAAATPGIGILDDHDAAARPDTDVIVVHGRVAAVDELVARMVREGVAVRELSTVVSPLEAAFLALTEQHAPTEQEADR